MRKLLSNKQKAVICQLAGKAYAKLIKQGCPMSESLDEWRRSQLESACKIGSLKKMGQEHYTFACNHFKQYLGMIPQADKTYDPRATQIRYIKDTMQKFELPNEYVMEIMRDKFGTIKTGALTVEQLTHLNYTLISRGRARAKKEAERLGIERPIEPHAYPETLPPGDLAKHFNAEVVAPDQAHDPELHHHAEDYIPMSF